MVRVTTDDLFDSPNEEPRPGPKFLAYYASDCTAGDRIEEDDEILMYDGQAWHVDCWNDELAALNEGLPDD